MLFGTCTTVGGYSYDMTADTAAVIHSLRNRMVVLLAGPVVAAYSIARMIGNLRCGLQWASAWRYGRRALRLRLHRQP